MKRLPSPLARRASALATRIRTATPRERTLLAALAGVGVLILLSLGLRWTREGLGQRRALMVRVDEADRLGVAAPAVASAIDSKTAALAPRKRSASELVAAVETLARESGLNAELATPRADRAGRLTLHRLKLNLRAPSLEKLMEFDDRLRLRGDGLVVERVTLESRSSAGEISAAYEIASCQPAS